MRFLTASHNILLVDRNCFQNNLKLYNIQLISDQISSIMPEAFACLPFLQILNLSHNCFSFLPKTAFYKSNNIAVLSLLGLTLSHTDAQTFDLPNLAIVESVKAQICCIVPLHTKCNFDQPQDRKCEKILRHPGESLRIFYYLVASLVLIFNVLAALVHVQFRKTRECLSILVICITCSEMVWGSYLTCLLIADHIFPGHCFADDTCWQSNFLCFMSSTLAFSSTLLSPVFTLLLAICRMSVTLYPFDSKFKDKPFVSRLSQGLCTICVLFAITIAVMFLVIFGSLQSKTCLFFVDTNTSVQFVKILTFSIFALHVSAFISIFYANSKTWVTVRASRRNMPASNRSRRSDSFMITQWVIMSAGNLLSWIVTDSIYVTSLLTTAISTEMLLWTSAMISSSKSIVHPVILSIALLRAVYKK